MSRSELTNPARRLPVLSLPAAGGGPPHPVRASGRRAPVLVLLHGGGCDACAEFAGRLAGEAASLGEWDGAVRLVVPEEPAAGAWEGVPFPVLVDGEGRLGRALSIAPPAVVVADQWGEVHAAHAAGGEHRFPPVADLVEWLRYLAIQCPECQGEAL